MQLAVVSGIAQIVKSPPNGWPFVEGEVLPKMTFLLSFFIVLLGCGLPAVQAHPLERALTQPAPGLELVYDDTHGLWGGIRFQLDAKGTLTRTDTPRGPDEPVRRTVTLSAEQVGELAALLLELQIWEQRSAPRTPLPDESKAELTVTADGHEAQLWEWYNEMAANDRMARVKSWLDAKAGAP